MGRTELVLRDRLCLGLCSLILCVAEDRFREKCNSVTDDDFEADGFKLTL